MCMTESDYTAYHNKLCSVFTWDHPPGFTFILWTVGRLYGLTCLSNTLPWRIRIWEGKLYVFLVVVVPNVCPWTFVVTFRLCHSLWWYSSRNRSTRRIISLLPHGRTGVSQTMKSKIHCSIDVNDDKGDISMNRIRDWNGAWHFLGIFVGPHTCACTLHNHACDNVCCLMHMHLLHNSCIWSELF